MGLNDLNIEEEEDFPASSSSSRGEERRATSADANPGEGSGDGDGDGLASNPGLDAIDREALDLDPDVHLGEGIMFE